jgi:hypothetical protein
MTAGGLLTSADQIRTEHRPATQTPFAPAAGRLNPRHPDAVSDTARSDTGPDGNDLSDGLVSKDARERSRQLAIRLMHVRVAQPAGVNLDQHLIGTGIGCGDVSDFPSGFDGGDNRSLHGFSFLDDVIQPAA